ncbi:MAG: hypothetical protein BGO96_15860 [Micrococcales bacterium 73-15]|uniref:endolytic transglycosylase MltG n=1 Tax=Salana multivorans TaxID=120377 RepID=UPI000965BFF9|nr:endolytic transglycosylase MltG [Salana multivorans]OJX94370.1 MAG: hypothetical protein BGO96_15860 [Micrococcales bacterium 73-15]
MTDLFDHLEGGHDDADGDQQSRRARRAVASDDGQPPRRPDRESRRRHRSVLSFVVMIGILVGLVAGGWFVVKPLFSGGGDPSANVSDYPGPGATEILVEIPEGSSGNAIGLILKDAGVVATTEAFSKAYSENSAATSIQPGTYKLLQQMAAKDAVAALLDPANRADIRVTIAEGLRSDQLYQKVADALGISYDDAYAAAHDYAALGLEGPPNTNEGVIDPMEGWFYPSTYSIKPSGTATDMFKQMYDRTIAELDGLGIAPEERLHVLTLGSIAMKETDAVDWPKTVRAMENRLAEGSEFGGKLQVDSTFEYAWALQHPGEKMDPNLHNTDASPYNTRLVAGLPPSPIGTVEVGAMSAVLSPEEGDWTYWITVDYCTRETRFTKDYQGEFLPWKAEFQDFLQRWQANDEKCPLPES